MGNVLLRTRAISKSYGPAKVLHNVHIELYEGEIVGLVGENGAGKSTLLKILSGVASPDAGRIEWQGERVRFRDSLDATSQGIGMVFQEQNLIPTIPVYENMFLGRQPRAVVQDKKTMRKKCGEMFAALGIDVDPAAMTGTLPLGTRQFLEIAKVFLQTIPKNGKRIVLLDEPTEALSKTQIRAFFDIIKTYKQNITFVLVSHRLNETIELCDRLIAMKDGEIVTTMQVTPRTTEEDIHELMVGRKRDTEFYQEDKQREPGAASVLELEDVTAAGAFEQITLRIREGEIVGLAGMLGSGRSELCRAVAGLIKPYKGTIRYLGEDIRKETWPRLIKRGICYVPPERKEEGIILDQSVRWNLSLVTKSVFRPFPILHLKAEHAATKRMIEKLSIKTKDGNTPARHLSGGNQQKVVLGKWLARDDIRLIIVEEPTRGIDVGAKQEVYKLLRELADRNVAVMISTENLLELIGLCNNIVVMKDGKITAEIEAPADRKPHEVDIVKYMV